MTDTNAHFNPDPWLRSNIRSLVPYHAARDDYHEGILLDANENSYGPAIPTSLPLHRYPDTRLNGLRQKWADFRGISLEQVFVGVGSDEAIDLLLRVFCEPGKDEIIITPPTYGMYKVAAQINNVGVTEAALTPSFELDARTVLSRVTQHTKLIMLCSPNNPTANALSLAQMELILSGFKRLVVVDEAYVDFSESGSLCGLMERYPNLVILQTLSKSFGMAAIRLGAALAHPKVIGWMMKVKAPYNVNQLTADAALQAFQYVDNMQKKVRQIISERIRLAGALEGHPDVVKVYPSETNFLLVRFRNALAWYQKLAARGVIVRYRGDQLHCENTLRITVGTPAENDQLIKELYDSPAAQTGHAANQAADSPAGQTSLHADQAGPKAEPSNHTTDQADLPAGQAGRQRTATHHRKTGETDISVSINLDGSGKSDIHTGLPFYDHMLDQIARHGYMDLRISCRGDLDIDEHHTIEDTAITLGEAIGMALGDKRGIGRYGFMIAMDESRSMAAIDLSGRPWCVFEGEFRREKVGDFPTEMTSHFFHSLAMALRATLHVSVKGENDHHKIEACFKALARCMRQAVDRNERYIDILPTSKGLL